MIVPKSLGFGLVITKIHTALFVLVSLTSYSTFCTLENSSVCDREPSKLKLELGVEWVLLGFDLRNTTAFSEFRKSHSYRSYYRKMTFIDFFGVL